MEKLNGPGRLTAALESQHTKVEFRTVYGSGIPVALPALEQEHRYQFSVSLNAKFAILVQVSTKSKLVLRDIHQQTRYFSAETIPHCPERSTIGPSRMDIRQPFFFPCACPSELRPRGTCCVACCQATRELVPCFEFFHSLVESHSHMLGFGYGPGPTGRSLTKPHPRETTTVRRQILSSALSSSFREHTRREGPTANTCAVCANSFPTNSGLESHAASTGHSAFLCACDTSFGRNYTLLRHINSKTGSGFHCQLCEDKTFGRVDKLCDHLRDGHKVSKKVLDRYKNKESWRSKKPLKSIQPAPAPLAAARAPPAGVSVPVSPYTQHVNRMTARPDVSMAQLTYAGLNSTNLEVSFLRDRV